jgi:glycine/D-amino acid oxidase-like deaminating enzyme
VAADASRILVSHTRLPLTVETDEVGVADDSRVDSKVSKFLHSFLPTQLDLMTTRGNPPPVKSLCEWTGIMGYSADLNPFVGEVAPGKWVLGGFHGHGMTRIWLCAKALVDQLLNSSPEWPTYLPRGYIYRPDRLHPHPTE